VLLTMGRDNECNARLSEVHLDFAMTQSFVLPSRRKDAVLAQFRTGSIGRHERWPNGNPTGYPTDGIHKKTGACESVLMIKKLSGVLLVAKSDGRSPGPSPIRRPRQYLVSLVDGQTYAQTVSRR
jgi:hypothetical protein